MGRGQKAGLALGSLHIAFPGSDGWSAAKKLGSHWAPFIFLFWALGSDGWAAAKKLGSTWDGWAALALGSLILS